MDVILELDVTGAVSRSGCYLHCVVDKCDF